MDETTVHEHCWCAWNPQSSAQLDVLRHPILGGRRLPVDFETGGIEMLAENRLLDVLHRSIRPGGEERVVKPPELPLVVRRLGSPSGHARARLAVLRQPAVALGGEGIVFVDDE